MRALASKSTAYDGMTLESCSADCAGYRYFGTEYGRECKCLINQVLLVFSQQSF